MHQRNAPGAIRRTDTVDENLTSRNSAMDALGSVVYAARLSDGTVKIGHTSRLSHRLHKLASYRGCGVELLAVMSGTREDEAAIHQSLTEHVADGREYYHATAEVMAVVNEMRAALRLAIV